MATCERCGRWAGFFRSRCRDCGELLKSVPEPYKQPLPPAVQRIETQISCGISFNLPSDFHAPSNGLAIVNKVYEYRSFPVSPEESLAKIMVLCNEGKLWRDFRRWLDERGGGYDSRYVELLFLTICLGSYSKEPRGFHIGSGVPYWRLSCVSHYCASHRRLDGLVRRSDDPVWHDLYPPNGWCCGCSVMIADRSDIENAPRIRVTPQVREKCRDWISSDLEEYINEIWH
jgi:hypothetical protein